MKFLQKLKNRIFALIYLRQLSIVEIHILDYTFAKQISSVKFAKI